MAYWQFVHTYWRVSAEVDFNPQGILVTSIDRGLCGPLFIGPYQHIGPLIQPSHRFSTAPHCKNFCRRIQSQQKFYLTFPIVPPFKNEIVKFGQNFAFGKFLKKIELILQFMEELVIENSIKRQIYDMQRKQRHRDFLPFCIPLFKNPRFPLVREKFLNPVTLLDFGQGLSCSLGCTYRAISSPWTLLLGQGLFSDCVHETSFFKSCVGKRITQNELHGIQI